MKLPELKDLILWDNRFGIVEHIDVRNNAVTCSSLGGERFFIDTREFRNGQVYMNIKTEDLYTFQEAIGENVYDPQGYVRDCRVIETARVINPKSNILYMITLVNTVNHSIVLRVISRYDNGLLYWAKA